MHIVAGTIDMQLVDVTVERVTRKEKRFALLLPIYRLCSGPSVLRALVLCVTAPDSGVMLHAFCAIDKDNAKGRLRGVSRCCGGV